MEFYFVYVFKSQVDGTTFIGSTDDLDKRLKQHNAGKTKSIRHKIPYELKYYEDFASKRLARKRELALKKNNWFKEKLYERNFE